MSAAAHSICPNYNRCNKHLEFTLKLDAYEERDRRKNAVIARKLSFGSQSTDGLRIRETPLTVMDTLRLRWDDPVGKLMEAFEAIAANPEADVTDILFPRNPAAGVGCLAARESAGVSRVRPIRTSTAVGLCPQPETAAEGSVLSRHIV